MALLGLIGRRLAAGVGVLGVVVVAMFALMAAQPGTVADRLDDPRLPPSAREALRARFDLTRPWPVRLAKHVQAAVRGDLGWSVARAQPVRDALGRAIGPSLLLGMLGLTLGVAAGLWLGTWQGLRAGSPADRWSSRAALVLAAVPDYWLALALLGLGARVTGWFPAGGWPREAPIAQAWPFLVLPVTTLALLVLVRISRYQRASVAQIAQAPWLRAARARGVSPGRVRWAHAARAAAAPTIALTGLLVPAVVAGTVFIEVVFAWPGIGRLLLDAVQSRDVPLAVGAALVTAAAAVAGSTAADLGQAWLAPGRRAT